MLKNLQKYHVILGSKSPRRKQLLSSLNFDFTVETLETEEVYPEDMPVEKIAEFLAQLKAKPFLNSLRSDSMVITADTVVCLGDKVLGKPQNKDEAFEMLSLLSGETHQVYTGVYILTSSRKNMFTAKTDVTFKSLTSEEINYYINNYRPFDKAGAYGIQEWIGHIGVEKIAGSYFNVMGLPVQHLYTELQKF